MKNFRNPLTLFEELSCSPETRVVSVDIFDTLLLRSTQPERVKFKRVGKEVSQHLTVEFSDIDNNGDYMQQIRLLAASIIYQQKPMINGAREATLDEIYAAILFALDKHHAIPAERTQALLQTFRQVEYKHEIRDLAPNSKLTGILGRARQAGKTVIAVSDMYLLKTDIEYLLSHFGLQQLFDHIYVSSEYGFGKASGALFDVVAADHGALSSQICHIGDNVVSDYAAPLAKGIKAVHAPRSSLWRLASRVRRFVEA